MAVGDNPVRGDLVPLRGLLNPEPVEIQQIRGVKPRYIADRWGILFDVDSRPLVVIAFEHLDRAVVNGPQRSQQALLSVLGILYSRAFELSACVLVPAGRLRVVHQVSDVHNLVGLTLTDEPNYGPVSLSILVRCVSV